MTASAARQTQSSCVTVRPSSTETLTKSRYPAAIGSATAAETVTTHAKRSGNSRHPPIREHFLIFTVYLLFDYNAFAAHRKMIVVPFDSHTYNLPPNRERRTDFGTSAESEKDGRLPE